MEWCRNSSIIILLIFLNLRGVNMNTVDKVLNIAINEVGYLEKSLKGFIL